MPGVITTGNHPKELWPGVNEWFGLSYKERPPQCTQVFDESSSSMNYEEDVEATTFGYAPIKVEGSAIQYDSHIQGSVTRYTHIAYALGFIVTREERDDNQYAKLANSRAKSLGQSMRQTKEVVAANVFNNGFTGGAFVGGDGVALFSASHPAAAGGTYSNIIGTAADLSEASLEDQLINVRNMTNARGLRIGQLAQKLIIPANEWFNAQRILGSVGQNDTGNNAINAVRSLGMLPDGFMVWDYLTDTDAWFIKTDVQDGLRYFNRVSVEFGRDGDFDTDNAKAKAYERYSFKWSDPRAIWGSAGA